MNDWSYERRFAIFAGSDFESSGGGWEDHVGDAGSRDEALRVVAKLRAVIDGVHLRMPSAVWAHVVDLESGEIISRWQLVEVAGRGTVWWPCDERTLPLSQHEAAALLTVGTLSLAVDPAFDSAAWAGIVNMDTSGFVYVVLNERRYRAKAADLMGIRTVKVEFATGTPPHLMGDGKIRIELEPC